MTARTVMIQNTMSTNNHKFVLNKADTKIFNWQVQTFALPDIELAAARATSSPKVGSWSIAGTAMYFNELEVTFLLDENIETWIEIYRWMKEIVEPYKNQTKEIIPSESTISIHVMNNNRSSLGKVFNFHRVWPVRLGGIEFSTTNESPEELTCTVTFKFDTYDLEIDAGVSI